MIPFPFLIALLIAFGSEPLVSEISPSLAPWRILETLGCVLLIGLLSFGLGGWVSARVSRSGFASAKVRRRYFLASRMLTFFGLAAFGLIIHGIGWSRLVLSNWGLEGLVLVDDILVFAPFVAIQLLVWSGNFLAERAIQIHEFASSPSSMSKHLVLKSRQSLGLLMPVVLIFVLRRDLIERFWPGLSQYPLSEPLELAVLGSLILLLSPLFVRLAWPTRSLPDGPLRRRLESAARRVGFRFTDLLVWDTDHVMVNACVTGVLPWFRYVLLSDALIDSLSPVEVAAVFGHEVGHVAHRHLPFFGLFFLGTLGMLTVASEAFSGTADMVASWSWVPPDLAPWLADGLETVVLLGFLGLFFWMVFGQLSRRFERQADVFGCRLVSCGGTGCPPHLDLEEGLLGPAGGRIEKLCVGGIQIFSDALATVARHNGIEPTARSWRHGSIASRIAFLAELEADPGRETRFQRGVRVFRMSLVIVLFSALLFAAAARSFEFLP